MKWLEGWFGTLSGVLGIVIVGLVALLAPAYTQAQSCMTSNGVTTCYSAYGPGASSAPIVPGMPVTPPIAPGPQPALLILTSITLLLFIGVLIGTWLDLSGRRKAGRILLLSSVSLLMVSWLFDGPLMSPGMGASGASGAALFAPVLPLTLLAFVAGILACVRHDAPKPLAAPVQPPANE